MSSDEKPQVLCAGAPEPKAPCPRCGDLFYEPKTLIEAEKQRAAEWEERVKQLEEAWADEQAEAVKQHTRAEQAEAKSKQLEAQCAEKDAAIKGLLDAHRAVFKRHLSAGFAAQGESFRVAWYKAEDALSSSGSKVAKLVSALEGIEHCNGYCPDHVGEKKEMYLEIIESLRSTARAALKEWKS